MKKFYTLIAAIALCTLSMVQAQWRVGASAGGDYNWYAINTNYQTDYRYDGAWGWNAAVFGQYNFLTWIGLRAELEASERNYRFYRTGIYKGTNYVQHNTYLQVPVMAQFSFGGEMNDDSPLGCVRGFVNLGVFGGCWLTGQSKGTWHDPLSGLVYKIDEPYLFNQEKDQRFAGGLAGGIGLEWQVQKHWAVHIEGRCYYDLLSNVKQYMRVKDYRYNTTLGLQAGFSYIF